MNDERNLGEKTDDSGQQPRYEHYQFHEEQGTVLKPSGPSGHRRNQNSFQKKAGATIALAVIFGLVAAVVFQAANFAADRFLNTGKSSVQIKTTDSVDCLLYTSGFCKAVNEGIRASRSPYVLLLNNDIEVTENFIEEMLSAIKRHPKAFSCAARMIQFHDRDRLDDAGNYYCALGWAYARGKGKDIHTYEKEEKIFASCALSLIHI